MCVYVECRIYYDILFMLARESYNYRFRWIINWALYIANMLPTEHETRQWKIEVVLAGIMNVRLLLIIMYTRVIQRYTTEMFFFKCFASRSRALVRLKKNVGAKSYMQGRPRATQIIYPNLFSSNILSRFVSLLNYNLVSSYLPLINTRSNTSFLSKNTMGISLWLRKRPQTLSHCLY